jgi:hypothetical protein
MLHRALSRDPGCSCWRAHAIRRGTFGPLASYAFPQLSGYRGGMGTCCAEQLDWRVAVRVVAYGKVVWVIDSFAPY